MTNEQSETRWAMEELCERVRANLRKPGLSDELIEKRCMNVPTFLRAKAWLEANK